ncbi:MAG TPA: SpoIIE family protein phosphatase [Candidatus Rubrimentiphilum sp.]|nr:SpoIIE family protein phosphatase [Candidatus Rubrimentiphilum sp.]
MPLVRSKIQSQAILLSIVPLAFLLAFLGVVVLLNVRATQLTIWTRQATAVLDQSDAILAAFGGANQAAADYTQHPGAGALRNFQTRAAAMRTQARRLVAMVGAPAQKQNAIQYSALTMRVLDLLDRYMADLRAAHGAAARALVARPSTRALATSFQAAKANFDRSERQLTSSRLSGMRDQINLYGYILLALAFFGIVLTLLTTGRFGLSIARRLRTLARNAELLGAGQTTTPVTGDDEIAELDRIYHEMAQRIHDTLSAYRREHYIASTLQRALLPQELPKVSGLRIDTAYAAAAHAAEIGGDWYDVFKIDDTTVGISVGDVAGHGLRAAAIMGSVRQAIRISARVRNDPGTVLDRVNRALCADEAGVIVTAFFATIDMLSGHTRYAVAGHPLPLVVHSGIDVEQLRGEGLILGVDPRAEYGSYDIQLRSGEALIGFTDGLIEVRRDYFKGMDDLIEAVKTEYGAMSSENIAEKIKDRILANVEPVDDSAVLFVGITNLGVSGSPQKKTWTLDVRERGAAYRVRRAVLWDLSARVGAGSDLSGVELILGELLSNVARHTPGQAEVGLEFQGAEARLLVRDNGEPFEDEDRGMPDALSPNGRGLHLVRSLARSVEVHHNGGNSIVVVLPVNASGVA